MTTNEKFKRLMEIKEEMTNLHQDLTAGSIVINEYQLLRDEFNEKIKLLLEQQEVRLEALRKLSEEVVILQRQLKKATIKQHIKKRNKIGVVSLFFVFFTDFLALVVRMQCKSFARYLIEQEVINHEVL